VQHAGAIFIDRTHLESGAGSINNTYGLYISTLTGPGQTNAPYAIYSEDPGARTYLAGNLGISSATPVAALVISSAAGSSDQILIVSTGSSVIFGVKGNGEVYTAGKFIGDGSQLTNLTGDGLGNHIATTTLEMGGYAINSSTAVSAAYYQVNGSTVLALGPSRRLNIGPLAGRISSGANNVFVGDSAGHETTTGPRSTFLGNDSGRFNTTGSQNSYLGYASGYSNTVGSNNTAVGTYAGYYSQTGSANAMLGAEAGMGAISNSFSSATLVGFQAGYGLTTGSDNILLGWRAGYNLTTGARNIIIGYEQAASLASVNDELNIGGAIYGDLNTKAVAMYGSVQMGNAPASDNHAVNMVPEAGVALSVRGNDTAGDVAVKFYSGTSLIGGMRKK
jgi:hypothetical protein